MTAQDLLGELADKFRALERFPELVAAEAAPLVEEALRATASAGTDPYGRPWPATRDGRRPLVHAGSHIRVRAVGGSLRATLEGADVWWHFREGKFHRQVLPDAGDVPPGVERAIQQAARRVLERLR
jgi:hypothetical protein